MIIALFALSRGLVGVVKASITGSIIGNILLVLGAAFLAGGSFGFCAGRTIAGADGQRMVSPLRHGVRGYFGGSEFGEAVPRLFKEGDGVAVKVFRVL